MNHRAIPAWLKRVVFGKSLVLSVVVAILALTSIPALPADPVWTVNSLMAELAGVKQRSAHFQEIKYLEALNQPLRMSGTLYFHAPDTLEKHVLKPSERYYTIKGNRLTIRQPGQKGRTVELSNYPALWALAESFRATLSGNIDTLKRFFRIRLFGMRAHWQLVLKPEDEDLAELVDSVTITGEQATVLRVTIKEGGSDRTELLLQAK